MSLQNIPLLQLHWRYFPLSMIIQHPFQDCCIHLSKMIFQRYGRKPNLPFFFPNCRDLGTRRIQIMLLRSLLMVSLLWSVYYVTNTQCFTSCIYLHIKVQYNNTGLWKKHTFILHRPAILLCNIVKAFFQLRLQTAQEIHLRLLEHFSECQL